MKKPRGPFTYGNQLSTGRSSLPSPKAQIASAEGVNVEEPLWGGQTEMNSTNTVQDGGRTLPPSFWKRLGFAGFLFFLIKGLLWLAAPAFFYFLT